MKRIWFTQQQKLNCNYLPLRWGLGQYSDEAIESFACLFKDDAPDNPKKLYCPKIYTTRTHPLEGEYYVVEGSRFKAKPIEPRIEFRAVANCQLDLRTALATADGKAWCTPLVLARDGHSFAELDLGTKRATFEQLRDELLRLNPKATLDTPFFVNKIEPLTVLDFNKFGGKI